MGDKAPEKGSPGTRAKGWKSLSKLKSKLFEKRRKEKDSKGGTDGEDVEDEQIDDEVEEQPKIAKSVSNDSVHQASSTSGTPNASSNGPATPATPNGTNASGTPAVGPSTSGAAPANPPNANRNSGGNQETTATSSNAAPPATPSASLSQSSGGPLRRIKLPPPPAAPPADSGSAAPNGADNDANVKLSQMAVLKKKIALPPPPPADSNGEGSVAAPSPRAAAPSPRPISEPTSEEPRSATQTNTPSPTTPRVEDAGTGSESPRSEGESGDASPRRTAKSAGGAKRLAVKLPPPPPPEEPAEQQPQPQQQKDTTENKYRFDEEDSESNIVFTQEDGATIIKGGTLEKLVERLTYNTERSFVDDFLLTYRSFTTPAELLDMLIARYYIAPPKGLDAAGLADWEKTKQATVRLRVISVLKKWHDSHIYDFADDKKLVDTLTDFLTKISQPGAKTDPGSSKAAAQLLSKLAQRQQAEREAPASGTAATPTGTLSKQRPPQSGPLTITSFMELSPLEIAQQMTLMEFAFYRSIKPWECLGQLWTKKDGREKKAANILAMIYRFNQVSQWVASEILKPDSIKGRAAVMTRFIEICEQLRALNNYNGMMEIVSGLQNQAVYRLKQTRAKISKGMSALLEEMCEQMSREQNYKNLRMLLRNVNPPCIPYLGMYLTDLTFLEDGMPDKLAGGLINFYKRQKVSHVIRDIQQYQQQPYNLQAMPAIQNFLQQLEPVKEDELFKRSLEILARGAEIERDIKEPKPEKVKKTKTPMQASAGGFDEALVAALGGATLVPEDEIAAAADDVDFELEVVDGYRFYEKDIIGKNIILHYAESTDRSGGEGESGTAIELAAGTLEKCVERLTYEKFISPKYFLAFLLTLRTFTTPAELLELLIMRYNMPPPKHPEQREQFANTRELPVRLRVVNVLKNWVDKYFTVDFKDKALVDKLLEFVERMNTAHAAALKRLVQKQLDPNTASAGDVAAATPSPVSSAKKPPSPRLPNVSIDWTTLGLLDFHPEEVARQMALLDHELFAAIPAREFLEHGFHGPPPPLAACAGVAPTLQVSKETAPHLAAFIERFFKLRDWVCSEVLRESDAKQRAAVLTQFVKIAEKCLPLNYYHGVMAIFSALQSPLLKHLKATWALVPLRVVGIVEYITLGVSSWSADFKTFHEKLHSSPPPAVPHVPIFLHELGRIDTTLPSNVTGWSSTPGDTSSLPLLINMVKRKQMASLISDLQQYQINPYVLEPVDFIQDYISKGISSSMTPERMAELAAEYGESEAPVGTSPASAGNSQNARRRESSGTISRNAGVVSKSLLTRNISKEGMAAEAASAAKPAKPSGGRGSDPSSVGSTSSEPRTSAAGAGDGVDIERLKAIIMALLCDDKDLQKSLREVLVEGLDDSLEVHRAQLRAGSVEEMRKEVAELRREVEELRAAYTAAGLLTADEFEGELKAHLDQRFAGIERREWTCEDDKGVVYGWPEKIAGVTLVASDEIGTYLVCARLMSSLSDVAALLRIGSLFTEKEGRTTNLLLATSHIPEDAKTLGMSKGVEIVVLQKPKAA